MKTILLISAATCLFCSASYAQKDAVRNTDNGYNDTHYYNYLDRSSSNYYTPVLFGPNGFRSVSEENILMDQMLAERRKREKEENMTPEEREQARIRQEEAIAASKKAADARKKPVAKAKK